MKYYEFDYKSKFQKILWNSNIIAAGILYTFAGFAITFILNNFLSTAVANVMLIISCLIGLPIIIYNSYKLKGVFLFEDHIEVSSIYTKKTIIPINEITNIIEIEKYGIVYKWDLMFRGGDRNNVIRIDFKNVGMVAFKIKNQDEFLKELDHRVNKIQQ